MAYDAFLSYSHAADGLLAPRLQEGLQRFAKPWWRRRALHVFRDQTGLSVNPHLWSSITEALDDSSWFVVLCSPEAARSEWVNREIDHWREHDEVSRILPVLTDGSWTWDDERGGFDPEASSAVPRALMTALSDEPRHLDLRWARDETDLDLHNSRFRAAVAELAAPMHGRPKEDLEGEEIRQHRRTVRTAWAGAVALLVLALGAGVAAVVATRLSREAADNERRADSTRLAAAAADEASNGRPSRALLLAAEALDRAGSDTTAARNALLTALAGSEGVEAIIPDPSVEPGNPPGGDVLMAVAPDGEAVTLAERTSLQGRPALEVIQTGSPVDPGDGAPTRRQLDSRFTEVDEVWMPSGDRVVAAGAEQSRLGDSPFVSDVELLDAGTGEVLYRSTTGDARVGSPRSSTAATAAGRLLVQSGSRLEVVDLASGSVDATLDGVRSQFGGAGPATTVPGQDVDASSVPTDVGTAAVTDESGEVTESGGFLEWSAAAVRPIADLSADGRFLVGRDDERDLSLQWDLDADDAAGSAVVLATGVGPEPAFDPSGEVVASLDDEGLTTRRTDGSVVTRHALADLGDVAPSEVLSLIVGADAAVVALVTTGDVHLVDTVGGTATTVATGLGPSSPGEASCDAGVLDAGLSPGGDWIVVSAEQACGLDEADARVSSFVRLTDGRRRGPIRGLPVGFRSDASGEHEVTWQLGGFPPTWGVFDLETSSSLDDAVGEVVVGTDGLFVAAPTEVEGEHELLRLGDSPSAPPVVLRHSGNLHALEGAGERVVGVNGERTIMVWTAEEPADQTFPVDGAVSADGRHVATVETDGDLDQTLVLYDTVDDARSATASPSASTVRLGFSPDGAWLAAGSEFDPFEPDGTRLQRVDDGSVLELELVAPEFSGDSGRVAGWAPATDDSWTAEVIDLATSDTVAEVSVGGLAGDAGGPGLAATPISALSAAGDRLAVRTADGLTVYEVPSGEVVAEMTIPRDLSPATVAFSPTDRTVVTLDRFGTTAVLRSWDRDGALLGVGAIDAETAGELEFDPSGELLLVPGSAHERGHLVDGVTLTPLGSVPPALRTFSADGTALIGAESSVPPGPVDDSVDPTVTVVREPIGDDELRSRACSLAGRNLTAVEWGRFRPSGAYDVTCDAYPRRG